MSLTRVMEQSELGEVVPFLPVLRSFLLAVSDGTLSTILEVLVCAIVCGRGVCGTLLLFFGGVVGEPLFLGAVGILLFFCVVGVLSFPGAVAVSGILGSVGLRAWRGDCCGVEDIDKMVATLFGSTQLSVKRTEGGGRIPLQFLKMPFLGEPGT
jgi:hypothetical protein